MEVVRNYTRPRHLLKATFQTVAVRFFAMPIRESEKITGYGGYFPARKRCWLDQRYLCIRNAARRATTSRHIENRRLAFGCKQFSLGLFGLTFRKPRRISEII